jgi:ketosteroid isomerase-like protein
MSTKEIVRHYFEELARKGNWESFLSDDLKFTSFTSPVKEVTGKAAYLESTRRFFSMIKSLEVRDLIIEGAKACVLTRYQLQAPAGSSFQSDVAELFTVANGKISALAIYFDTAPFPK